TRSSTKEISKKISIGLILSLTILILYGIFSGEPISLDIIGICFFLIGGILLVIGGLRDIFESVLVAMIKGKRKESFNPTTDPDYLFGFGVAGEDVIAGSGLIILAVLSWLV
ncbi:MAG: hypothetical protein ACFFDT_36370, partial [Candidatus Hodarchaeota archaeon]